MIRVFVLFFLPFSLLRTRPKQPYGPPHSALPPPCGPAGSRAHGNMQSGPCWSAASRPGKDPTAQKEAQAKRNDQDAFKTTWQKEERQHWAAEEGRCVIAEQSLSMWRTVAGLTLSGSCLQSEIGGAVTKGNCIRCTWISGRINSLYPKTILLFKA